MLNAYKMAKSEPEPTELSGLTDEQALAEMASLLSRYRAAQTTEEQPGQLAETSGPDQAGKGVEALADMAATLSPATESGWKSRKVWVALTTLVGMLAQVPLDKRLSPQELIAVACVAVAYISWQAMVDIAKVRAREPHA